MMKKFREFMYVDQGKRKQEYSVYFHGREDDVIGSFILNQLLSEDKKEELGKGRYVYKHSAHTDPGQAHLHFYQNGAHLYALNKDGSAHDQSHGKQMARWAIQAVQEKFPGFQLPTKGLIEAMMTGEVELLNEGIANGLPCVPADVLQQAEDT